MCKYDSTKTYIYIACTLWRLSALPSSDFNCMLSQFWYRERWTCIPLMWGILAVLAWGTAIYFFKVVNVYQTEVSGVQFWKTHLPGRERDSLHTWIDFFLQDAPAESRGINRDCLTGTFFDNHDLWHVLSAIALYSTASVSLLHASTARTYICVCLLLHFTMLLVSIVDY